MLPLFSQKDTKKDSNYIALNAFFHDMHINTIIVLSEKQYTE